MKLASTISEHCCYSAFLRIIAHPAMLHFALHPRRAILRQEPQFSGDAVHQKLLTLVLVSGTSFEPKNRRQRKVTESWRQVPSFGNQNPYFGVFASLPLWPIFLTGVVRMTSAARWRPVRKNSKTWSPFWGLFLVPSFWDRY